jgi:hypothetical protein
MSRVLLITLCAALLVFALGASTALAGEVKGPPGTPYNFNDTAAPAHANSACAYSGLNDLNPAFGQTVSIVQTAADSFKYYGYAHGVEGTLGLCQGGTN